MKARGVVICLLLCVAVFPACQFNRAGDAISVGATLDEPSWIRDGEPIEFNGEKWFPTREIERFMDNEIYQAGVYREVTFYLDKADIKPFERLYTRFAKGRYRAFERRE